MELINKGDTVYLGFEGQVCKFTVQRVDADFVWLAFQVENVVHVRRVDRARVLALILKAS